MPPSLRFTLLVPIPKVARGIYGCLWGESAVGKTTGLAAAFPQFSFLMTSASALQGALAWNRAHGLEEVQVYAGIGQQFDPEGRPLSNTYRWINDLLHTWEQQIYAARSKLQKPDLNYLPSNVMFPGLDVPRTPVFGVVLSEMTTLWGWIDRDAKTTFGRGWDSQEAIKYLHFRMNAFTINTGISIILDCHGAPAIYSNTDSDREVPDYPAGPSFPFKALRPMVLKDCEFSWRMRRDGNSIWVDTQTESTTHEAIKTRQGVVDLNKNFKSSYELTSDFNLRDVMMEAGIIPRREKEAHQNG